MFTSLRRKALPGLAATLAVASSIAVGTQPPGLASAAGLPLEVISPAGSQFVGGVVVVAPTDVISVTFQNVGTVPLDLNAASITFDAAQLVPGAPVADALTSIGVDPAAVVHDPSAIALNSDTCANASLAINGSCTIEIEVLSSGLGSQRPFGTGIQLTDLFSSTVVGETFVVWPPAPPVSQANDDFVDAQDISALAIPPFQNPLVTAQIGGDTTDATVEPGEPWVLPGDPQSATASVWYRYTSPPGGFAGQLGYTVTPGFIVSAWVAGQPDPFNPSFVPGPGPGQVDQLVVAPGNDLVPQVDPHRYVRMEPGHTVWFHVFANPLYLSDGPFTLELAQAPNQQDEIVDAFDAFQGNPYSSAFGWYGDGTTYHTTPDVPGGLATTWATHVIGSDGLLSARIDVQTPLARASTEPVGLALYRAPGFAPVTDAAQLGTPVAVTSGGLESTLQIDNGQYVQVPVWIAELRDVAVQPGRYYVGVIRPGTAATFFGISTRFNGSTPPPDTTPPTVTITSPANAAQLVPADVPALAYTCTDASAIAAEQILVDGRPGTGVLPTTLGAHSVEVLCTDAYGNTGRASVSYTVVPALTVPDLAVATDEDTALALDLFAGVTAPGGVTLAVTGLGTPQHGTVVAGPGGAATYTPAADYHGPDQFTYTITTSRGDTATASVAVTVRPVNDPPVAVDDTLTVNAGQTVAIDFAALVGNDTDIDGGPLSIAGIGIATPSLGGQLTTCDATRPACRLYVAATVGGVENVDYTVSDGAGGTDTGRLRITVVPAVLPDTLLVNLTCPGGWSYIIGGPTSGLTVTPLSFGLTLLSGRARLGTADVRVALVVLRGGVSTGRVQIFDPNLGLAVTLYPRNAAIAIGSTWVMTGTWWRPVGGSVFTRCSFQVNITDGG